MDPTVSRLGAPVNTLGIPLSLPSQSSVIHSPNGNQDEIISDEEARKRRELLARRPSYRKILNDLSDVDREFKQEIVETTGSEGGSSDHSISSNANLGDPACSGPLTSTLTSSEGVNFSAVIAPGLNHLNGDINLGGFVGPGGGPILQYVHPSQEQTSNSTQQPIIVSVKSQSDLLGLKPVSGSSLAMAGSSSGVAAAAAFVNQGLMPGYTPPTTSPLPTASNSKSSSSDRDTLSGPADDSHRKRQVRLLKNREAAKECRRKKKEYVKCLENRVAVLENQNKALIEELKTLKELYCRKGD